jgi:hypothetical protein
MTLDDKILLGIFIGSFALLGGGIVAIKLARGIRNNNPGNIEKGISWKGIDPIKTAAEPRFIVFSAPEWGIRAMVRLLKNYQRLYGLDTVREIIGRWSPDADPTNPAGSTTAYIGAVAKALTVSPDQSINLDAVMPALVRAIIKHENGTQPYSAALISRGIELERTA